MNPTTPSSPRRNPKHRGGWPRLLALLALTSLSSSGIAAQGEPAEGPRILFFGNSFTYYNDMPEMIGRLARAEGYPEPFLLDATSPGKNLAYHREQVATNAPHNVDHPSLGTGKWDFVIIQGSSFDATSLREDAVFRENIRGLLRDVHSHPGGKGTGARAVMFQTWAYHPDNLLYRTHFGSAAQMHTEVRAGYRRALEDFDHEQGAHQTGLAPVGDAFAQRQFDQSLYADDLYHPSQAGSVLAALILYRSIYGTTVSQIPHDAVEAWVQLTATDWAILVELADAQAVVSPSWQGYPIRPDGWVETGNFLGSLWKPENDSGWMYSARFGKWLFLGPRYQSAGQWAWIPRS